MKKNLAVILVLCVVFQVYGGSLEPSGPPTAGTMKPLDQVEPRTAITSLPFPISSPGSYYLAGNLSLSNAASGISITASNVTLDLCGFELKNTGIGYYAINSSSSHNNIVIKNGTITGWNNGGVHCGTIENLQVLNITVDTTGSYGIQAGAGATITDCHVNGTTSAGIIVGANSVVSNCTAGNGSGYGFSLTSSTARCCKAISNTSLGFYLSQSRTIDCMSKGNQTGFYAKDASQVINSTAAENTYGIRTYNNSGNRVDGNLVINNGIYGIQTVSGTSFIVRNVAYGNGTNYGINSGNTSGQIITGSTGMTASNPWANFQF